MGADSNDNLNPHVEKPAGNQPAGAAPSETKGAAPAETFAANPGFLAHGFDVNALPSVQVSPVVLPPDPSRFSMAIGKQLTLWLLMILAGSILLLVAYLWRMEISTGDDIRRNYGKDLNREDVSLYLAQRLANFSNALTQAGNNDKFSVSEKMSADEKAMIETLNMFPGVINDQERDQLEQCVALIKVEGTGRKDRLQPCLNLLDKTKNEGMTAAAAAFSFQMASEASTKLLEQRQSLHEFWLKAAQLILLNLLLPVLTAALGYTFGNQAQKPQQQQGQD